MSSRSYRVQVDPLDALSTASGELTVEVWTGPGSTGYLLASGTVTSGDTIILAITDIYLDADFASTRYVVIYDGAGNFAEYSFSVEPGGSEGDDNLGGSIITLDFVFEWRDHRYAFIADLTPSVISATVALDNDQAVSRTARFVFDPAQFPEGFDPAVEHVSIRARFTQGGTTRQFPLGLFLLDVGDEEFNAAGDPDDVTESLPTFRRLAADAADVVGHLAEARIDASYSIDAGTNYIEAVEALVETVVFAQAGGTTSPLRYAFPGNTETTPVLFTWDAGTSVLAIINDLLMGINYYPAYADGTGIVQSRERTLPWDSPIDILYTTRAEPRMIISPFRLSRRRGQNANVVLAVNTDPLQDPAYAAWQNVDPVSRISTVNDQVRLKTLEVPFASSSTKLAEIAKFELAVENARSYSASLKTVFDPRRGPQELYQLQIAGVADDSRWVVFGWSLSMTVGAEMEHSIGLGDEIAMEEVTL